MKKYIIFSITLSLIISCNKKTEVTKVDKELSELFTLMQGSFNSEKQAKIDSTYYNISLHMYPIWKEKGNFLYVEQALNTMQNRPYRQRIYEIKRLNDSTLQSIIYKLPTDSLWIGKWKTPDDFNTMREGSLILRNGCEVLLKKIGDNHFKGSTGKKTCQSNLRGASYATSEVEIMNGKIISWDRGFDDDGKQIWGAEKGGYIFDKITPQLNLK